MTEHPQESARFIVASSGICFGELHNIWHGASRPAEPFPDTFERLSGGTVKAQLLSHNLVAENGTWIAYQLTDKRCGATSAWFVCHSETEPITEVLRILNISGSPYEDNPRGSFNDEDTKAGAVYVINRYDWGYYDKRGKEALDQQEESEIRDSYVALGLVDHARSKELVQQWVQQDSRLRESQAGGLWMEIPDTEYMFGRFGFDADRRTARSFLFFSAGTDFGYTTFPGSDRALREAKDIPDPAQLGDQPQIPKDKSDSEGIGQLKRGVYYHRKEVPPADELLGPYSRENYVLQDADLDAVHAIESVRGTQFHDRWKHASYACFQELILSYLEHFLAPAAALDTIEAAATSLFPRHSRQRTVDNDLYVRLTRNPSDPIAGFNDIELARRVRQFLAPRSPTSRLISDNEFVKGIVSCISWLLKEVLELANQRRRNALRKSVFPHDIRESIFYDDELLNIFRYSKYFWEGERSAAPTN